MVTETMEFREKHNVSRKDFIQLLMELRKTGKITGDDVEIDKRFDAKENAKEFMTMEQCAAQVALLYLAGFDTTASAIAYCLFELSQNAELMERLHAEIDEVLERHNNVLSYDIINEMTFLDHCIAGEIIIFVEIVRIFILLLLILFNRNITFISNITISQPYLHKGLPHTKYGFDH